MRDLLSPSGTYLANLHPIAARFNLRPHLTGVTLAHILAGDTCSPISLAEFEKYLAFVEYSIENLQFLVWFQDYRKRYLESPCNTKPLTRDAFWSHSPSRLNSEISGGYIGVGRDSNDPHSSQSVISNEPPQYTKLPASPEVAYAQPKTRFSEAHRFRLECSRAIATFLTPGAAKELPLDAVIRDTVIRNLSQDSHPDLLLPVYDEIYGNLERCSLPRFLAAASVNINFPKQMYWYSVGILNVIIGIMMALLLITMLPTPPEANRAWRLFAAGFFALGAAQCYSAWRGYCSQVWLRCSTQLRVWEMQEMDAESQAFVNRILGPPESLHTPFPEMDAVINSQEKSESKSNEQDGDGGSDGGDHDMDLAIIAPFAFQPGQPRLVQTMTRPSGLGRLEPKPTTTRHHFHRPPLFGPEKIVLDPRIKAVHRQLMINVFRFGIWLLLGFSALVLSVPGHFCHSCS